MGISWKMLYVIILALSFSARECDFRNIHFGERELNSKKINGCQSIPPYQQFRTSEGCRICTNCTLLGLLTVQECGPFSDAVCKDKCLYKNDLYDPVTKQCVPSQIHGVSTSTEGAGEKSTKPTAGHNKTTAAEEVLSEVIKNPVAIVFIWTAVALIPLAALLVLVCFIWKITKKSEKRVSDTMTVNDEAVPMMPDTAMQNRPLPPTPPTERKKPEASSRSPSTSFSQPSCSEGVPDPQVSMDCR